MIKKFRFFSSLLSLCMLFSLVACSQPEQKKYDDLFLKIENANTRESLTENYEKIAFKMDTYTKDGLNTVTFTYQDKAMFIHQYTKGQYKDTLVDKGGHVVFHTEDNNTHSHSTALFIGENVYEELLQDYPLSAFVYDPLEKVISQKEENGQYFIEAEVSDDNVLKLYAERYNCPADQIEKSTMLYRVSTENYVINNMTAVLHFKDGTSATAAEMNLLTEYADYMPDNSILMENEPAEKRTITLIESPDKKHEFFVPVGYKALIMLSDEYDNKVFADSDYTTELTGNTDLTKNVTLYIRKAQ